MAWWLCNDVIGVINGLTVLCSGVIYGLTVLCSGVFCGCPGIICGRVRWLCKVGWNYLGLVIKVFVGDLHWLGSGDKNCVM